MVDVCCLISVPLNIPVNELQSNLTILNPGYNKLVGKLKELLTACTQECDRIVTVTATMADRSQKVKHTVW